MPETEIVLYGAAWCPDCRRSKAFLGDQRIPYRYVDLEAHPEEMETVLALNDGKQIIPTIVFADGTHVAEPSNEELAERLGLTREAADVHVRRGDHRRRADRPDGRDLRRAGGPADAGGREVGPGRAGRGHRATRQLSGLPRGDRRGANWRIASPSRRRATGWSCSPRCRSCPSMPRAGARWSRSRRASRSRPARR